MLTTIHLPAGTERVYLRDVPGLIADALHPELPEGTPSVLSYVQKKATDRKLAWQWCGMSNDFPVSLTEQDLRELNDGVWHHLPPIKLLPDSTDGPQKVATLLPEPEWEKYAQAFAASPPEGWRLIAVWRNRIFEQWVLNDETRKQWARLLEQQSIAGQLTSRDEVSGIPTYHRVGRQLMEGYFTIDEFTAFARRFDVEVRVPQSPSSTGTAETEPVLAQPPTGAAEPKQWKMRVQAEAAAEWKRMRAMNCNPTRASIRPHLLRWCKANNVLTSSHINPSDGYLRTHVLSAKHWTPPN